MTTAASASASPVEQSATYGDEFADVLDDFFPHDSVDDGTVAAVLGRIRTAYTPRVLELGCGTGRYAIPLARAGARVEGWDLSGRLLERARRAAVVRGASVTWVRRDIRMADDRPGRFDLVTCLGSTLSMLEPADQGRVLACAAAMLDPDGPGRVVIETHHRDNVERIHGGRPSVRLTFPRSGGRTPIESRSTWDAATGRWRLDHYCADAPSRWLSERSCVLTLTDLAGRARDAGLSWMGAYGSFAFEPLTHRSPQAVIDCVSQRKETP